jgi:acyl-CoA dehydrogenase
MSESLSLLSDTAERLFGDLMARQASTEEAWTAIEDAGLPLLLVSEGDGGFGGDWADAFAVLRLAGAHALSGPLADVIAASWVGRLAGWESEKAALAQGAQGMLKGGRFSGVASGVGWGVASGADSVFVGLKGGATIALALDDAEAEARANPAGEPRLALTFQDAPARTAPAQVDAGLWGALARTAQIAGALNAALALSIAYANERTQFGKPIGKFQAVQQSLAEFAEEAAAVNCAGRAAARAADCGDAFVEIAAAKIRAGQAAAIGARVAHQVHGAIGFTREHKLHLYTTRLAAWRSEFGNERDWSLALGAWAAKQGAEGLWSAIAARSDAQNAQEK